MATTISIKYSVGDVVYVFMPSVSCSNPTIIRTKVNGFHIKTLSGRVNIYYTLDFVREEVLQGDVYPSVEKAKDAIDIEDYIQ